MKLRLGRLHRWETPLALLGIVLLSYGLWIPWMGLFGNDLPYLWYYHRLGPWGPGAFASIDRPFSAAFYAGSTFLLGETVWLYHAFLLLLRGLSAVLLWWVLTLLWPERRRGAAAAALFFAVYPGFRQNPIALEFILHFCVLDLFLLSLGASLLAARQSPAASPKRFWPLLLVSMVGAGGVFWLEYFIGLEVLRPLFLWLDTRRQGLRGRAQWKRIAAAWLPVVAVVAAFLIWRIFIFSFPTYRPVLLDALRAGPLAALLQLAQNVIRDLWTVLGRAWLQVLQLPEGRRSLLAYLALAAAAFGLAFVLLRRAAPPGDAPSGAPTGTPEGAPFAGEGAKSGGRYWGETLLGIGLLAMLAGGSIFWVTGIPVTVEFPWDRSTLSFMLGASLATAGLLEMAVTPRYRAPLAAALVALAVGMHFINAQEYRAEWQKLRDFYWQLTWRAPGLEPGTLALFDVIPLNRYSDNDMTALLNWTYAPDARSHDIDYKVFDLNLRLGDQHVGLPGLEKDLPVEVTHRGVTFRSTTSSTLAVSYNPPACLKILTSEDALLPEITGKLSQVLPMTRLAQVRADGAARPPAQLGAEPPHGWCYYYQKAALARQQGDWASVTRLGDQAAAANLRWNDPSELLPFIEGYAMSGNLDQARALSIEASQQPALKPALCALWKRLEQHVPSAAAEAAQLGCSP